MREELRSNTRQNSDLLKLGKSNMLSYDESLLLVYVLKEARD